MIGFKRRALARLHQVAQHRPDRQRAPRQRPIRREAQNSALERLDFDGRFIALDSEKQIAGLNKIAIPLEPLDKHAFFHRPAKPG